MFNECAEAFTARGNHVAGDDIGIDNVDTQPGKRIAYQCLTGANAASQAHKERAALRRYCHLAEYPIEVRSFNFLLIEQGYPARNGEVRTIRNGQVFTLTLFNHDHHTENSTHKR